MVDKLYTIMVEEKNIKITTLLMLRFLCLVKMNRVGVVFLSLIKFRQVVLTATPIR
jgi:hypothetical protein